MLPLFRDQLVLIVKASNGWLSFGDGGYIRFLERDPCEYQLNWNNGECISQLPGTSGKFSYSLLDETLIDDRTEINTKSLCEIKIVLELYVKLINKLAGL